MVKQFVFEGMGIDGTKHQIVVDAESISRAVSDFMRAEKPVTMGWAVRSKTSIHWIPVTRERWGHTYDGK